MGDRRIPDAPDLPYQRTFAQYVEEQLEPLLPQEDVILSFHRALMRYVDGPDPLFIVRWVTGLTRGKIVSTDDETRLLPSDNAPAWWWHMKMFHGTAVSTENFAEFVRDTPAHLFGVSGHYTVNTAGWHAAHILPAKDGNVDWRTWTRTEAARRFVRNVHPLNLFYVPGAKALKAGGEPELIGYVAWKYAERWPTIWKQFTAVAGTPELRPNARDRLLRVPASTPMTQEAPATEDVRSFRPDSRGTRPMTGRGIVKWKSPRLRFYRDRIEPLDSLGRFRIETPHGSFEMTKSDFHSVFSNVVQSESYRDHGYYHYRSPPKKALRFRVSE